MCVIENFVHAHPQTTKPLFQIHKVVAYPELRANNLEKSLINVTNKIIQRTGRIYLAIFTPDDFFLFLIRF